MAEITELNSNNDKKLERILEANLIKYDNAKNDDERLRRRMIIDEIYAFERVQADKCCEKLSNSIGFAYFIKHYNNFERSLHYFSYRLADEILYMKEDIESLAHNSFNSKEEFMSSGPNNFLISVISKYDEDLANYIKVNILEVDYIANYIKVINDNWDKYNSFNSILYKNMISRSEKIFEEQTIAGRFNYSKTDILIYLSKKYDMLREFKEYYIMEDTTEDELNELIETNNVDEEKCSEREQNMISMIDSNFKEYKEKKKITKLIIRLF